MNIYTCWAKARVKVDVGEGKISVLYDTLTLFVLLFSTEPPQMVM